MSFVGLYTGLSGVRASQTGIDLASNNVANSATPGYTRQRMSLEASAPYGSPVGPLGTGVTVAEIGRLRDSFLDTRARGATADHGAASARAELLTTLEELTSEPDDGISTRLTALWTAAEAWANDPADPATRRQVMSELGALGETFRSVAGQWDVLGADVALDRDTQVTAANDALAALAELDGQLAGTDQSRIGPSLLDQRDLLLDEISSLTGATTRIGEDGRAVVTLGEVDLLSPDGAATLAVDGGTLTVTSAGGEATALDTGALGGVVGGLTRFLNEDLPTWRGELDQLAAGIADAINDINTTGVTADGTAGEPLLSYDAADAAGTLARTTNDHAALAAATSGAPPEPHDGSNAARLAQLRTEPVSVGGGTAPLDTHLSDLVTGLAGDVRAAKTSARSARAVASSASNARQAEHGVSVDEEMVELVRHQRALEASARVMTTVDQALDTLVNRVGIVGR